LPARQSESKMRIGFGLLKPLTPRLLGWRLSVNLAVLLWIASTVNLSASNAEPDILGLRLGMSETAVRSLFEKSGIPLTERNPREVSAPRPLGPLEGVEEVRIHFDKDRLSKIAVSFQIPPREPTADNVLLLYDKEKRRLEQLFGPPSLDFAEMKAPNPTDRHEWLTRGRGYYKTAWKVKDQTEVSLWLYGEDAGIVLIEIYEKPETH